MQQNVGSKSEHQAEEAKFSDKKVSVSTPESPNLQIRKIATHIHVNITLLMQWNVPSYLMVKGN